MEQRKKTYIEDIDRNIYDIIDMEDHALKVDKGLTEDIIREISAEKKEPKWMLDFRLRSLEIYNRMPVPNWAADLTDLDVDNIVHYVKPNTNRPTRGTMCQMTLRTLSSV